MQRAYSIGQLAKAVGVSVSTLRRWDKEGLLIPHITTEGGHRRYTEEAVMQIVNKRLGLQQPNILGVPKVKVNVDLLPEYRSETTIDYSKRVTEGLDSLYSDLKRYQDELAAIVVLQGLTSNPIMTSLLEKERNRVDELINSLTSDLSGVAVDILHTIHQHYKGAVIFDTLHDERTLVLGGKLGSLVEKVLFQNPARMGILVQHKPITAKKVLSFSLDFMELLRRIDFYYTTAGIPLKSLARKKQLDRIAA